MRATAYPGSKMGRGMGQLSLLIPDVLVYWRIFRNFRAANKFLVLIFEIEGNLSSNFTQNLACLPQNLKKCNPWIKARQKMENKQTRSEEWKGISRTQAFILVNFQLDFSKKQSWNGSNSIAYLESRFLLVTCICICVSFHDHHLLHVHFHCDRIEIVFSFFYFFRLR